MIEIIDASGLSPGVAKELVKAAADAAGPELRAKEKAQTYLIRARDRFGEPYKVAKDDYRRLFNRQNKEAVLEMLSKHRLPKDPSDPYILVEIDGQTELAYLGDDDFGVTIEDWGSVLDKE